MDRRTILAAGGGVAAMSILGVRSASAAPTILEAAALPDLPYAYDALEPVIDKQTVGLHHDKHHAGYVRGFNGALEKLKAARAAGDFSAIKHLSRDLAFHGSGHAFHTLYWDSMKPGGRTRPGRALGRAIDRDFGSFEDMLGQFRAATKSVEGSGWGVLAIEPSTNQLVILQSEKHQNLTVWGCTPLMVCDVWEHAYYLKYQNMRGDYIAAFCDIIDWEKASKRFDAAV